MCVVVRLSVGWLWHRWRCFSCRVLRPPCFFRSSERCVLCSSQDTYTQRRAACSFLLSDLLCKNARLTTNSSRFLTTHNCFRAVNLTTPSMYEEINGRLSLALQNISECSLKNLMEMSGNRHRKSWTPRKTCWQDWNIFESLLVRNNIICIYFMNLMLPCMELTCYVERRMKAPSAIMVFVYLQFCDTFDSIWQVCIWKCGLIYNDLIRVSFSLVWLSVWFFFVWSGFWFDKTCIGFTGTSLDVSESEVE